MIRAIESVSERPEVRKVLATEIGRSLGGLLRQPTASWPTCAMPACAGGPVGARPGAAALGAGGQDSTPTGPASSHGLGGDGSHSLAARPWLASAAGMAPGRAAGQPLRRSRHSLGPTMGGVARRAWRGMTAAARRIGQVDPALMS
jgi:hypothetical protein